MNEITIKTRNKAIILGNLNPILTLWHRLQTTFETTNEHIIKRKKQYANMVNTQNHHS